MIISLTDWNQFLTHHPNVHLLQTGEWGELKGGFGWKPVRIVKGNMGVQILFRKLPFGLSIGYIPKANPDESLLPEIDEVCMSNRAIFLKVEPDLWNESPLSLKEMLGARVSFSNIQPPRTIVINLRGSENDILAKMKQKTRYNIRLAEKKNITIRTWDDIKAFYKMMLATGSRDGFGIHSAEYYKRAFELLHSKGLGEILVAEYDNKPLAALFVAFKGKRAYYLYGASTDEERNRMPTYLLQWEAMKWAKEHGCEEYDLWGVPDEDEETLEANFQSRNDGLWGVYRFKRGFGGVLKRASQSLDRVYSPILYWLYSKFFGNRD